MSVVALRPALVTQWTTLTTGLLSRPITVLPHRPRAPWTGDWPILFATNGHIGHVLLLFSGAIAGVDPNSPNIMGFAYLDQVADQQGRTVEQVLHDMDLVMDAMDAFYRTDASRTIPCVANYVGAQFAIDPSPLGLYQDDLGQLVIGFDGTLGYLPCPCP